VLIATELRAKRQRAGLTGYVVCRKAGICRSCLSDVERGYIKASEEELTRIDQALEELIQSKQRLMATAAEVGWPVEEL
jgi:ferredoxin